jgi:hypothetical protein
VTGTTETATRRLLSGIIDNPNEDSEPRSTTHNTPPEFARSRGRVQVEPRRGQAFNGALTMASALATDPRISAHGDCRRTDESTVARHRRPSDVSRSRTRRRAAAGRGSGRQRVLEKESGAATHSLAGTLPASDHTLSQVPLRLGVEYVPACHRLNASSQHCVSLQRAHLPSPPHNNIQRSVLGPSATLWTRSKNLGALDRSCCHSRYNRKDLASVQRPGASVGSTLNARTQQRFTNAEKWRGPTCAVVTRKISWCHYLLLSSLRPVQRSG